jgi:hypothetical protein
MLHDADLEAAVTEGIVTQAQVDAMHALSVRRSAVTAADRADDERFRFMRGFNDIFFTVGVALLGIGLTYFTGQFPFGYALAMIVTWGLAEVLVARLRLVLPGILLACLFALFTVALVQTDVLPRLVGDPSETPRLWTFRSLFTGLGGVTALWSAVIAGLAAGLFYLRFRLPFTLLLIAGSAVVAVLAAIGHWMLEAGATVQSALLLACGLAVFAAAMWYDLSDRERVTRRADCAFWLHLLAAPLIVHSLVRLLAPTSLTAGSMSAITPLAAVVVAATIAVLTIVALLIDRRALFVSGLTYLGIIVGYVLGNATGSARFAENGIIFATLLILGLLVLGLGLGWRPLRRAAFGLVPRTLVARLPPIASAA